MCLSVCLSVCLSSPRITLDYFITTACLGVLLFGSWTAGPFFLDTAAGSYERTGRSPLVCLLVRTNVEVYWGSGPSWVPGVCCCSGFVPVEAEPLPVRRRTPRTVRTRISSAAGSYCEASAAGSYDWFVRVVRTYESYESAGGRAPQQQQRTSLLGVGQAIRVNEEIGACSSFIILVRINDIIL